VTFCDNWLQNNDCTKIDTSAGKVWNEFLDYRLRNSITSLSIEPYDVGQAGAVIGWTRECSGDSAAFHWQKGRDTIYSGAEMGHLGVGYWF